MRAKRKSVTHSLSLIILNSGNVKYDNGVHEELLQECKQQQNNGLIVVCSQESAHPQVELPQRTHIDNQSFMVKTKIYENFSYLALDVFQTGPALTVSAINHRTNQYRQANKGGVFTEIELTENETNKTQRVKFVSLHLDANSPHKKYSQFLQLMEKALSPDQTVVAYDDILTNINLVTAGDYNIRIEGYARLKNQTEDTTRDRLLEPDAKLSGIYNTLGVTSKLRQLIGLCGAGELIQVENDQERTYEKRGFSKKQRHNDIGEPVKDEGITERATSNPCSTVHLNRQIIHTTHPKVSDHHNPASVSGSIHFLSEDEKFNRYKQHLNYMLTKMENALSLNPGNARLLTQGIRNLENNAKGKTAITFLYNVMLRTNMLLAKSLHFDTLAIEMQRTRSDEDIQQQCLTPKEELQTLAGEILQSLNSHFPNIKQTAEAINETLRNFTSTEKQALKHKSIYQSFKGLRGVLNFFLHGLTRLYQTVTFHRSRTQQLVDQLQKSTNIIGAL